MNGPLPKGWTLKDPRNIGWTSEIILGSDAFAIKNGTNWVAVGRSGVTTMSGSPVTNDHIDVAVALGASPDVTVDR